NAETDQTNPNFSMRKNLQETAFFIPQLHTDETGAVRFTFTMPEALTEWKFIGLAHTTDAKFGQIEGRIKTQKELMVQPNLPRFLRQGDLVTIKTKISNLTEATQSGLAEIKIVDAATGENLNLPFGLKTTTQNFSVDAKLSTAVQWDLKVPQSLY